MAKKLTDAQMEELTKDRTEIDILDPDTCPNPLRKFYTDEMREQIAAKVSSGEIKTRRKYVKLGSKSSGTTKVEYWPFKYYYAVKTTGATALAGGAIGPKPDLPSDWKSKSDEDKASWKNKNRDGVLDYFNYGLGLYLVQPIRNFMIDALQGAEKAIEKQVTQMLKTGLFTKDEARDIVLAQRKARGDELPPELDMDEDEDSDDEDTQPTA
jgi:hypothetical protein